ncbi:hypothetical protein [Subdoligranulum variabile]|uniref:Uncharacterized protein n=1 Tax=Subdoligranulum variabile DSM 15176 TaxID=411471 RepID=D1PRG8_9FIRM|nr:hypothetical protein [Subdoligranulum variabile]EFB74694.1 hypothetical protein SUBVAR_06997 [Subdoligranulum variabile DSM 15176]UWP69401.1 hypothetical protein NQ490_06015 [Subdoligranulum variabile]
MNKVKRWIVEQFLPAYARETLLEENERLRKELEDARAELREMQHYAAGLEYTVRHLPANTVYNHYENNE